jgi:hypothetical protein
MPEDRKDTRMAGALSRPRQAAGQAAKLSMKKFSQGSSDGSSWEERADGRDARAVGPTGAGVAARGD